MRAGTNKRPIRADNKPILNIISDAPAAAAYALRRLNYAYTGAPIRVRDDTATETDIGFSGENLDTGGLLGWLKRNLVTSIPLGVDGNADGVSDGWSIGNDGVTTVTTNVANGEQEITITNASSSSIQAYASTVISCVPGNNISCSVKAKISGTARAKIWLVFYNVGTPIQATDVTSEVSGTDYVTISLNNITAPANTTRIQLRLVCRVPSIGGTGTAYFKDASVTISNQSAYIKTWYDQTSNGNHATQSTAANQPRIVNAGVLDIDISGKPTMVSPDSVTFRGLFYQGANISSVCSMSVVARSYGSARIFGFGDNTFDTNLILGCGDNNVNLAVGARLPENQLILASAIRSSHGIVSYTRNSTTSQQAWKNGASIGTNTNATTTFTGTKIGIGYLSTASPIAAKYDISEAIIFNPPLTDAQRQKLERNQGKYYNISVV